MSIFWIGGPERIVSEEEKTKDMFEDSIFLPGIIHGDMDLLIRVYLNDCNSDDCEVQYLTRRLILEASEKDPTYGEEFDDILNSEAECFGCYNDASGDYASIIEEWPKTVKMSNAELVAWAKGE